MAYHIKKTSAIDSSKTVYFKGDALSDDYSSRKTYSSKSDADAQIANPDGKNGGFTGCTVVSE